MSNLNEQIAFLTLVSPLHDPEKVEKVISKHREWLSGYYDYEIRPTSKFGLKATRRVKASAGVLALVMTGGTERLIQRVVRFGRPTIIITHESMNSLPAALEALASLEDERPQIAAANTHAELRKIACFVKAAKAFVRIRNHRLGLIGGSSPWLTYSQPNRRQLSRRLGIKLTDIPMDELTRAYKSASKPLVNELAIAAESKGRSSGRMTEEDFRKSNMIYVGLRKLVEKHNLTAASLKCFDLIADFKATGCYAVATLNDENFVTGCEGDVPATAAMIVLGEISKSPTFLANACFVKGRNLTLAHCTIAPRLTTKLEYRTHFESGLGVAIAGVLKRGARVTIVRFSKTLDKLRAGEGAVAKGDAWSEDLCRTQTKIKMDGDAELIRNHSLGNHYVVTYGEHVDTLRALASFARMEFEEI